MFSPQTLPGVASPNTDSWDGYRAPRARLFDAAAAARVKHLVVLTGDVHSSWAYDLTPEPFNPKRYEPATGQGAVGTEIITPAVSSPPGFDPAQGPKIVAGRPHLKYFASSYRGYVVLDITREQLQADWWSVPTVLERTAAEQFEKGVISAAAQPSLADAASPMSPIEFEE
jgi:alkaline phosphatase D